MLFAKLYLGAMIMMAILVRCRSIRPTFVHQIRLHSRLFSSTIFNGAAITQRCDGYTHLDDIEDAATSCLSHHLQQTPSISQDELLNNHKTILNFPHSQRESIGVASNIKRTLDSFGRSGVHCRRCWLQRKHCVCGECVSLEGDVDVACDMGRMGIPNVKRLFLLIHHKEICLAVDTAKLIVSSFPSTSRLVVSGIPSEFQPVMGEMLDIVNKAVVSSPADALKGGGEKCLILFPTEDARTFEEIIRDVGSYTSAAASLSADTDHTTIEQGWNVIVLDGTWSQARKIHAKYFPTRNSGMLFRVQLSSDAVNKLGWSGEEGAKGALDTGVVKGLQLRRHPIKWREISTLEATRLLLLDMHPDGGFDNQSQAMSMYEELGNVAVKGQLGPPRRQF